MARKKIYIAENLPIKTINGVSVVGSGDVSVGSTYTHPVNHNPSIITQDASNRFVTDTEKTTWNGKQNALVSGTTIKTINGTTLLGSGDIVISAGSTPFASGTTYRSQSRAFGTNYTNSQNVPIFVMVTITASTVSHINVTVGSLTFGQSSATSGTDAISFIVPPGAVYKVTRLSGTATLGIWAELY